VYMNLIDLVSRKDKILSVGNDLLVQFSQWQGQAWRTLKVLPSNSPQLILDNISQVRAFFSMPYYIGWYCSSDFDSILVVTLENNNCSSSIELSIGKDPVPIRIPWLMNNKLLANGTQLKLHFNLLEGDSAKLFVHRKLDRSSLIGLAEGKGHLLTHKSEIRL